PGAFQHRGQLARDRERGTTAATQVDLLVYADQLLGGEPRQAPEDTVVCRQVYPPQPVKPGGQARLPDAENLGRGDRHNRHNRGSAPRPMPPGNTACRCAGWAGSEMACSGGTSALAPAPYPAQGTAGSGTGYGATSGRLRVA